MADNRVPEIGEHDNSSSKGKGAHDGYKSFAFNLKQPRNPQPEAVWMVRYSTLRRGFHRRFLPAKQATEPHSATHLRP